MGPLIKFDGNRKNLMFPEFPSLFDDFLTRDFFNLNLPSRASAAHTLPAVNVKDTAEGFELEMAAPGMDKKDFKIEVEQDVLIISAQQESNTEEKSAEGNYSRREFNYRSFKRAFHLPEDTVNSDGITASYKDGILYVQIPKKEESKSKAIRAIEVA